MRDGARADIVAGRQPRRIQFLTRLADERSVTSHVGLHYGTTALRQIANRQHLRSLLDASQCTQLPLVHANNVAIQHSRAQNPHAT